MKVIKEKHPLMMRWTHWINFPTLAVMVWSGLLIYWASDIYHVSVFGITIVHFFPDWFYNLLNIPSRPAEGMAFHFLFMWFFKPLRRALNKTELFFRRFFSEKHLVKTYPKSMAAKEVRVNSVIGIDDNGFNPANWRLLVVKNADELLS